MGKEISESFSRKSKNYITLAALLLPRQEAATRSTAENGNRNGQQEGKQLRVAKKEGVRVHYLSMSSVGIGVIECLAQCLGRLRDQRTALQLPAYDLDSGSKTLRWGADF